MIDITNTHCYDCYIVNVITKFVRFEVSMKENVSIELYSFHNDSVKSSKTTFPVNNLTQPVDC